MRMALTIAIVTGVTAPARADDISTAFRLIDTVRVGAFAHNVGLKEDGDVAVSAMVMTSRIGATTATPQNFVDFLLTPRLHAGVMANTSGNTSYGYAGLTWRADLIAGFFTELEFGGAVNNFKDAPDRINMGCNLTFRESAGLGYRLSEHFDVLASIEHASHADLCDEANDGVTEIGVRLGYRF